MEKMERVDSSYRDPSGFVFKEDGVLYRKVDKCYAQNYSQFISSGLYDALINQNLLVAHTEIAPVAPLPEGAFKILRPQRIPFVSYPYEWTFSQLRDAALLTLNIQEQALQHGMCLKDATPYNVQFIGSCPIFIDTLSFEAVNEHAPWIAYGQFCRSFLAPLLLAHYSASDLLCLQQAFPEGMPLGLASSLLPLRAKCNFHNFLHIVMHGKAETRFQKKISRDNFANKFSIYKHRALVDSLKATISHIKNGKGRSTWSNYYQETNYSAEAFNHKIEIVTHFLNVLAPDSLVDVGANTGIFSELAPDACYTVSVDGDMQAVDIFYTELSRKKQKTLLPLHIDVRNPSPDSGWMNRERDSLLHRSAFDTAMALALLHHLAIGANLPFEMIARFFCAIAKNMIIEFVPKEDSQIQKMLCCREDIFPKYTREIFEEVFSRYFEIKQVVPVKDSLRTLYWMTRR